AGDLRAISILSSPFKLFELVVLNQINDFITAKNLMNPLQTGTHTVLIAINDDRHAINKQKVTLFVSIDQSQLTIYRFYPKSCALWDSPTRLVLGLRGFETKLQSMDLPITFDGQIIQPCKSVKLLGVTLNNCLTMKTQCIITASKCYTALFRLRKNTHSFSSATKLLLIKTLIFPYLECCPALFLDLPEELTTKLYCCKHATMRFVEVVKRYEHISPTYRKYGIASYKCKLRFLTLNLLTKILRSGTPFYLRKHLDFRNNDGLGFKRARPFDYPQIKHREQPSFGTSFQPISANCTRACILHQLLSCAWRNFRPLSIFVRVPSRIMEDQFQEVSGGRR
ncbi:hypothetical protein TSAR_002914, partial [Trichomalopsis sarcophagae]